MKQTQIQILVIAFFVSILFFVAFNGNHFTSSFIKSQRVILTDGTNTERIKKYLDYSEKILKIKDFPTYYITDDEKMYKGKLKGSLAYYSNNLIVMRSSINQVAVTHELCHHKYQTPWKFTCPYYVSRYASENSFEDICESIALYVHGGVNFRALAKNNVCLKMKYEYLKKEFENIEFNTFTRFKDAIYNFKADEPMNICRKYEEYDNLVLCLPIKFYK